MYREDLYEVYQRKLHEAMNMDEDATNAYQRGQRAEAADLYDKAADLYSKAAAALLDVGEECDAQERVDIEKSFDRLIGLTKELKACAERLRSGAHADKPTSAVSENEEEVRFASAKQESNVCFDDIVGLKDAKQLVLDEIINPLLYEDFYKRFLIESNGGLLLFGPPGGGKTMMARAIAREANMAFFSVRCSDIVGKYFGEAEKHVQALFKAAREAKDAVIFLDEAEALACRRGGNSTVMNRLVPELLSQMDGFERFDGHIIVIFATNRPYDIDPAFLRGGRLPHHCYIPLPDLEIRRAFLSKMVAARPCEGEIDVEKLALGTERFSCADLANLMKRACQQAVNRSIERKKAGEENPVDYLRQEDLDTVLSQLYPSVETAEIERLEKWMKKIGMKVPEAA